MSRRELSMFVGLAVVILSYSDHLWGASSGNRDATVERLRLAFIKRITSGKQEAKQWRTLIYYVRTGPSGNVQRASIEALKSVKTKRVKNALLDIAVGKYKKTYSVVESVAQGTALRGLEAHVKLIEDKDIELLLEKAPRDIHDTLVHVGSKASLSRGLVRKIVQRYPSAGPNVRVDIIFFAATHLKAHKHDKEFSKAGKIAAYEVIGREVVLYWRDMAAQAKVKLSISLVAAVPGTYTGPASRAYQYYTDEFKHWVAGLEVTITPR